MYYYVVSALIALLFLVTYFDLECDKVRWLRGMRKRLLQVQTIITFAMLIEALIYIPLVYLFLEEYESLLYRHSFVVLLYAAVIVGIRAFLRILQRYVWGNSYRTMGVYIADDVGINQLPDDPDYPEEK